MSSKRSNQLLNRPANLLRHRHRILLLYPLLISVILGSPRVVGQIQMPRHALPEALEPEVEAAGLALRGLLQVAQVSFSARPARMGKCPILLEQSASPVLLEVSALAETVAGHASKEQSQANQGNYNVQLVPMEK